MSPNSQQEIISLIQIFIKYHEQTKSLNLREDTQVFLRENNIEDKTQLDNLAILFKKLDEITSLDNIIEKFHKKNKSDELLKVCICDFETNLQKLANIENELNKLLIYEKKSKAFDLGIYLMPHISRDDSINMCFKKPSCSRRDVESAINSSYIFQYTIFSKGCIENFDRILVKEGEFFNYVDLFKEFESIKKLICTNMDELAKLEIELNGTYADYSSYLEKAKKHLLGKFAEDTLLQTTRIAHKILT